MQEVSRFTFGDQRFPSIQVKPVDADNAIGGLAINEEEAALLEAAVAKLIEQAHLRVGMRDLEDDGLTVGSAVAVLSFKRGELSIECPRAEHCLPTFDGDDPKGEVAAMTWCYEFEKTTQNEKGSLETNRYMFRRDFDRTNIVEFEDVIIRVGQPIQWHAQPPMAHGFTFCPVVWICNASGLRAHEIDGCSLFEGVLDEFDALNFALSQRHRGIAHFGTPQLYETGVEENDGPEAEGQNSASRLISDGDSQLAPFGRVNATEPARKLAPNSMWSYRGANVSVGAVETTGKAFEAASSHVNDIAQRLKESMQVVLVNVAEVLGKGEMSAKFLELAYASLLAHVDDLRGFWWLRGLRAILCMALRMLMELGGRGVFIPGADRLARLLRARTVQTEVGPVWLPPELSPVWGQYFSPNNQDKQTAVTLAATAFKEKLISRRTATSYVAPLFGVKDADKEIEDIDSEGAPLGLAPKPGGDVAPQIISAPSPNGSDSPNP